MPSMPPLPSSTPSTGSADSAQQPEDSRALTGRSLRRAVLTRSALGRLALGWLGVGALAVAAPWLAGPLPGIALVLVLAAIVAVIVIAAGGVVQQAEALAHRLGDPYGTLVLTLSIVVIEVVLIAAVMLGPGDHLTIARDSVMAVSMIILNLALGICLVAGGLRHGLLRPNRSGTAIYLVLLTVLGGLAFALPHLIGTDGSFAPVQAVVIAAVTVLVYGVFLWRQTGARAADFQEVGPRPAGATDTDESTTTDDSTVSDTAPISATFRVHRAELLARAALLIITVLPIVLLSHDMADLLDDGLARLGAPAALGGVLIAMIVFTPESITAVRAALGGEIQRVVNLCHGALVSTFGLTIPTVLVIGQLTGQQVVLAESPVNLVLLAVTLGASALFTAVGRSTALQGVVHLALFAVYAVALFL